MPDTALNTENDLQRKKKLAIEKLENTLIAFEAINKNSKDYELKNKIVKAWKELELKTGSIAKHYSSKITNRDYELDLEDIHAENDLHRTYTIHINKIFTWERFICMYSIQNNSPSWKEWLEDIGDKVKTNKINEITTHFDEVKRFHIKLQLKITLLEKSLVDSREKLKRMDPELFLHETSINVAKIEEQLKNLRILKEELGFSKKDLSLYENFQDLSTFLSSPNENCTVLNTKLRSQKYTLCYQAFEKQRHTLNLKHNKIIAVEKTIQEVLSALDKEETPVFKMPSPSVIDNNHSISSDVATISFTGGIVGGCMAAALFAPLEPLAMAGGICIGFMVGYITGMAVFYLGLTDANVNSSLDEKPIAPDILLEEILRLDCTNEMELKGCLEKINRFVNQVEEEERLKLKDLEPDLKINRLVNQVEEEEKEKERLKLKDLEPDLLIEAICLTFLIPQRQRLGFYEKLDKIEKTPQFTPSCKFTHFVAGIEYQEEILTSRPLLVECKSPSTPAINSDFLTNYSDSPVYQRRRNGASKQFSLDKIDESSRKTMSS